MKGGQVLAENEAFGFVFGKYLAFSLFAALRTGSLKLFSDETP